MRRRSAGPRRTLRHCLNRQTERPGRRGLRCVASRSNPRPQGNNAWRGPSVSKCGRSVNTYCLLHRCSRGAPHARFRGHAKSTKRLHFTFLVPSGGYSATISKWRRPQGKLLSPPAPLTHFRRPGRQFWRGSTISCAASNQTLIHIFIHMGFRHPYCRQRIAQAPDYISFRERTLHEGRGTGTSGAGHIAGLGQASPPAVFLVSVCPSPNLATFIGRRPPGRTDIPPRIGPPARKVLSCGPRKI